MSKTWQSRLFSFLILLAALSISSATLADAGRFQAIAIPEVGGFGQDAGIHPKVFILDTEEGHLWTWSESEAIYEPSGKPRFGTVLIYQGRLQPGKTMGEIIDRHFDK